MAKGKPAVQTVRTKTTWANAFKRDWQLYLLLLVPVVLVIVFNYAHIQDCVWSSWITNRRKDTKGVNGSVGKTFIKVFNNKSFLESLRNSIVFNLLDLVLGFPIPVILALILNELRFPRFKKVTQTILYLPHFLSWAIVGSVALPAFQTQHRRCQHYFDERGID